MHSISPTIKCWLSSLPDTASSTLLYLSNIDSLFQHPFPMEIQMKLACHFFFIKILFSSTSYLLVFFMVSFYVSLYSVFPVHLWACIDRVKSYLFVVNHFTDDCFPLYLMSSSWQLRNKRHVTAPVPTLLPPGPNFPSCLHVTFYQLSVKSVWLANLHDLWGPL